METLISRIREEVNKIKKRGDVPNFIWLGASERQQLENLMKDIQTKDVDIKDVAMSKSEIMGIPFNFVTSERWMTVSYKDKE